MPPDRVFGRVEKNFRKIEEILAPNDYYRIYEKHGTVKKWGKDWHTSDIKTVSKAIFKNKMPFKISQARVIIYNKTKKSVTCQVQNTYTAGGVTVDLFKKGIRNANRVRSATLVDAKNHVSQKKKENVQVLLKGCDLDEDAQRFYEEVSKGNEPDNDNGIVKTYSGEDDTETAV